MQVYFEYLGEDKDFPDAKKYKVEAIHVMTTRNMRKFTKDELELAGRSLAFRPLNINHDDNRQLPFPENATLNMDFNPKTMAVEGRFRVLDPAVNAMIETGRINTVSIEQIPTKGEHCHELICEQHGVAFIGMALLENDVPPGDPHAHDIVRTESTQQTLTDLLVSNDQRTCSECTDFEPCHTCKHTTEQGDDCISKNIREIKRENPQMKMDQVIAIAFSKCGLSENSESAWWWYRRTVPRYEKITNPEFDQIFEACLERRKLEHPEMSMELRVKECLEELNRINKPASKNITILLNEKKHAS